MLIAIDHGNKSVKLPRGDPFVSGLVESEVAPFGKDVLKYRGRYYQLSDHRIPYHRDKTEDERFFILTLFAIAREINAAGRYTAGTIQVQLAVGLPPAHFGAQHQAFTSYFPGPGSRILCLSTKALYDPDQRCGLFPQSYAAAVTILPTLQNEPRALVLDIGGFTADYLQLRNGEGNLAVCDSLESGVISLYNKIISKVNAEHDMLLDEDEIDAILLKQKVPSVPDIGRIVERQAQNFVNDLFSTLRERGLELKDRQGRICGRRLHSFHGAKSWHLGKLAPLCLWRTSGPTPGIRTVISSAFGRQVIPMADKMQPGRFTLRFNMNDPQQRAAVEILNRMGRQKAQFIAQALIPLCGVQMSPANGKSDHMGRACAGAGHPIRPFPSS